MTISLHWEWKSWSDLDTKDLYTIIQLRQAVFIVEQNCPYIDADGLDQSAYHLLGWSENRTLAVYTRVFLPDKVDDEGVIGRVIVHKNFRRKGLGLVVMEKSEEYAISQSQIPLLAFHLSAQAHLRSFYEQLGYRVVGDPYDEDGIPHLPMRKGL